MQSSEIEIPFNILIDARFKNAQMAINGAIKRSHKRSNKIETNKKQRLMGHSLMGMSLQC